MRRGPPPQQSVSTRDRILEAAVHRFSHHSYEATGLRDIAHDVGVDVAYVHRCFGSKERLFSEAVHVAIGARQLFPDSPEELSRSLAAQVVARDRKRPRDSIGPLDIVLRSLSSPCAASVLRDYILDDFIRPLGVHLDQPALRRASLIAAFLTGLGILRNVLEIAPLHEASGRELETLIASVIQHIGTSTTEQG